ncbi:hypothetical protein QQS21_006881 [Conoideocrella luteorostrata]|uniref:Zn(2)-C6 fungal-type domain-containing protein n=1 Tax=Conoideocrella luteorostrata TaxID=1105319 RepID=A0AAJ0FT12_9HYPO|nr:hypothetical protein QQS21_006881 [Conoideocrella luteorostrata]
MVHDSQVPRSCDRCHSLKERCKWTPGCPQCERCTRVGHVCKTRRPIKRPGRPPAPFVTSRVKHSRRIQQWPGRTASPASTTTTTPEPDLSRSLSPVEYVANTSIWKNRLSAFGQLTKPELALLDRAVHQDDFIQLFVLGPSFCDAHRQKLVFHLLSSRHTVLDGYLAFALSMGDRLQANNSYKYAASALVTLRSLSVTDPVDSASCLILGWQILHFVLKLGGGELLEVCSQTLSLIKPYFSSARAIDSAYFSFLTSLVVTETAECLFKARKPTLRLDHPATSTHIDGCVGLCTSLAKYAYDVATLNHAMHRTCRSTQLQDADITWSALIEDLNNLECQVRSWKPNIPIDFCQKYTATEVAHMMCQAQVMHTALLLIMHRLRFPFGIEDATAFHLASSIINCMDMALHITGKRPRGMDMPLNVASVEIADESERAQNAARFSAIGKYSGVFQERIGNKMALIWTARRSRSDMYWYDLGDILSCW